VNEENMRKRSLIFSQDYAMILTSAWQSGGIVTSEDVASILYYSGKSIPGNERSRAIRNAVMTLTRMQTDGLIANIFKGEKKRMRQFKVISREDLKTRISKELKELLGENF
jgi:hypothetical protein